MALVYKSQDNTQSIDDILKEMNGLLDDSNIKPSAGIDISKTDLGTYTAWTDFTPARAVGGGGTAPDYTANDISRYCQIGKVVYGYIFWKNSAAGVAGAGAATLTFSLPIAPTNNVTIGTGWCFESGGTICPIGCLSTSGTTANFYNLTSGTSIIGDDQSSTARQIHLTFMYEVT